MVKRMAAIFFLISLLLAPPSLQAGVEEEALWSELRAGGYVVLLRHAVTEPGTGDPPGFRLGDCSTQRNLSAQGRADARRIGEAFRRHQVPVFGVWSSRWCRCLETAQLAFGKAKPAPMLDSMYEDGEAAIKQKIRALRAALARRPPGGNLILVTHNRNVHALTGLSPASGEMVVVRPDASGMLKVIGRLDLPAS
jgi:broad specificity phosphatase PhoE